MPDIAKPLERLKSSPAFVHDALGALDAAGPAMIATVEEWSAINSGSGELAGLRRMAARLTEAFSVLPGEIEALDLAPGQAIGADGEATEIQYGQALRLRVRPEAPVQVALTGHYDTVFPATSRFQRARRLDADTLNGPGVADMKGGLIVMLEALKAFERTPLAASLGYGVLISPDEEVGSVGSAPLLAALGRGAAMGMTYEPALPDGSLAGARKGSGNFSMVVTGRAAHVGRAFEEGRNAVVAAAEAAMRLSELNGVREGVVVNVGKIDGGGPVNVVPATAVVRFNVRAPDEPGCAWAKAAVSEIVRAVDARDGLGARLHGGFTRPPKPMTPAQDAVLRWTREAGADLALSIAWAPTGGVCEGNNLFAAGCPNVDTLGVRGGAIHSEEEFALVSSFPERAKLSFLLLCGLASGRWDLRELKG